MNYFDDLQVLEVVRKVRALRRLTVETGVITKRSQGQFLQTLDAERLAAAAELLNTDGGGDGNRSR